MDRWPPDSGAPPCPIARPPRRAPIAHVRAGEGGDQRKLASCLARSPTGHAWARSIRQCTANKLRAKRGARGERRACCRARSAEGKGHMAWRSTKSDTAARRRSLARRKLAGRCAGPSPTEIRPRIRPLARESRAPQEITATWHFRQLLTFSRGGLVDLVGAPERDARKSPQAMPRKRRAAAHRSARGARCRAPGKFQTNGPTCMLRSIQNMLRSMSGKSMVNNCSTK
jgi:hypothetical protein